MGEGILLVTFAYIPALIVAYNLGVADLVNTWPVEWSLGRFYCRRNTYLFPFVGSSGVQYLVPGSPGHEDSAG